MSDTDKYSDLLDYLDSNQGSSSLQISKEYLEPGVSYTFTVWFENQAGTNISDTLALSRAIPDLPEISVEGDLTQTLLHTQKNIIKINLECTLDGLSYDWSQESGDTLPISDYVSTTTPTWLRIDACDLTPDSSYEVRFEVEVASDSLSSNTDITLEVLAEEFEIAIHGASDKHPYD